MSGSRVISIYGGNLLEKMYKKPCRTGSQQLTSDISTLLKSVKK